MPRQKTDYSRTTIYKIVCKNPDVTDIYVGRTTDYQMRYYAHKCNSSCQKTGSKSKGLLYETISANGGWDNWEMSIVEQKPCENVGEADDLEQHWINSLQATLNTHVRFSDVPYKKEWYFKNRERVRLLQKETRERKKQEKIEYSNALKIDYENLENNPEWFLNNVKNSK